uniref:Phenylalanine--tRNA ligase beta subunit n=1 Tax=Panstrongylus megistus TaxID=65343 RepID=A0A069DWA5_9HEMI
MPTISIKRDLLFKALNQTYTEEEFTFLCFDFGLELDDVTSERQMIIKEQGANAVADGSDDVIYRIEVPANRYDLLCLEGLVVALLVFQNRMQFPHYKAINPGDPKGMQRMFIKPNTKSIRPHVVAAVLRDITFDTEVYASFIDLQEKLHQNLARKRTLVSIGTHDLDTIQGPFTYDALPPDQIKFKPLNQDKEYTGKEIMELYANHAQLKQYLHIIKDSPYYPIITDANGVVLSLPPIINGDHSKIKLTTKNVFIEVTATDLHKAHIVLDTMVTAFSYHCKNRFSAEKCEIVWTDGSKHKTPTLSYRKEVIDTKKVNEYIGFKVQAGELAGMLTRMCLQSKTTGGADIVVRVPPTRHDILHAVDIYEDAAIAFGYNNIVKKEPNFATVAIQDPLNKLSNQLRHEIAYAGFAEVLSFSLCSKDDISKKLKIPYEETRAVEISNPKTLEFQVVRTSLIPGLLKSLSFNKDVPLPIKLFEISDVVYCDETTDTGARNLRKLCALYYDKRAGFEYLHGLLDRVMQVLDIPWEKEGGYYLSAINDDTFFPKRAAEILWRGNRIGKIGVLHPDVINAFDLPLPCSVMEMTIEPFV